MKRTLIRWSLASAMVAVLAACGGGGGGGTPDVVVPPVVTGPSVKDQLATAAAVAANDTSVNSAAPFVAVQAAGLAAVTVNSPPKVNFAVFSDGKVKSDLTISNVSFAIAKLVPGTNGNPDQWVNYVYRKETAVSPYLSNSVPSGTTATQATTDGKMSSAELTAAGLAAQLVYNADGYYTYTFKTDIKDPAWKAGDGSTFTNGVTYEPARTHRIAIQLSYKNAAGATVLVNPYFDFTIGADGKSVQVTDPSKTRKMTDVSSCNGCHDKLALHGGGRVDTQFCVMCHNLGTTDANSGNVLNLSTMVHKIHAGRELAEAGEHYTIWGYQNSKNDYSEVGFPQPLRNCARCHDGANPLTPQGDNWKSRATKEACLTCHQSGPGSDWLVTHSSAPISLGTTAANIPNSSCTSCHSATSPLSPERVHWVQEMANIPLYQAKVESVSVKSSPTTTATGTITVKYSVINPSTNVAYDLREGCSQASTKDTGGNTIVGCNTNYRWDAVLPPTLPGKPTDKFGMFTVYVGVNTLPNKVDDDTATANKAAYLGVDDGTHHYTMDLAVPAGTNGNMQILLIGSVSERRLNPVTREPVGAVPPTKNSDLAYVPVKNAIYEYDITQKKDSSLAGTARRKIVSNDNCNVCHYNLGLPTSSDPNVPGFHKGLRNNAEGCNVCHNANQAGSYTLMTDGSTGPVSGDSQLASGNTSSYLHESYQAKRFIHGIHGGSKRSYPFTHCMNVGGAYNKDGSNQVASGPSLGTATCLNQYPGSTTNFTAEVQFPGHLSDCSNCHINDSWKQDRSVLGSVVFKATGVTDPLNWQVISPKAATCTACHDSKAVQTHVKTVGASFGSATQNDLLNKGLVFESCEGCHTPGSAIGVDMVHGK